MKRLSHWGLPEALAARQARQLLRVRRVLEGPQGPRVRVDGQQYLAFCSNDYLGLAAHPALAEAMREATADGVGSGASALVCGRHRGHVELEEALAEFLGVTRCLLFSTGYMANLGVATALFGREDVLFCDQLNHASLIDAARLCGARKVRFPHADPTALAGPMPAKEARRQAVVSDALFSMDGDLAPIAEFRALADRAGAALWVDDAHGIGVLGDGGRGTLEHLGLPPDTADILVGTLGKAFGVAGAFVGGEDALIETLVQHARNYIYTTAPPPPVAAAALAGLRVSQAEPERRRHLLALVRRFRAGAAALGLPTPAHETPIQPLVLGETGTALGVAERLQSSGILVLPMRPPTVPEGTSRLRITFSAAHTEADVDRLLETLAVALGPAGHVACAS